MYPRIEHANFYPWIKVNDFSEDQDKAVIQCRSTSQKRIPSSNQLRMYHTNAYSENLQEKNLMKTVICFLLF